MTSNGLSISACSATISTSCCLPCTVDMDLRPDKSFIKATNSSPVTSSKTYHNDIIFKYSNCATKVTTFHYMFIKVMLYLHFQNYMTHMNIKSTTKNISQAIGYSKLFTK